MPTPKPIPIRPFPAGVLSANLSEIPRWRDAMPLTAAKPAGVNLETAWSKANPGRAWSAIQQGQLGTCVPMALTHCAWVSSWNQSPKGQNHPIAEWLYWVARHGMPTDENASPQGCAFYNAVRAMQFIGCPTYGPASGIPSYDWQRALAWGDNGPPAPLLRLPRLLATMVRRIVSAEEFVSAINAGQAVATYGNWSFFNNDPTGQISGPSVSPSVLKPGDSPLSMWGHALSGIGYEVRNGKPFAAFRNHSATKNHTGGQSALFPFRGTGVMDLQDPILQKVFSSYTMASIGGVMTFPPAA